MIATCRGTRSPSPAGGLAPPACGRGGSGGSAGRGRGTTGVRGGGGAGTGAPCGGVRAAPRCRQFSAACSRPVCRTRARRRRPVPRRPPESGRPRSRARSWRRWSRMRVRQEAARAGWRSARPSASSSQPCAVTASSRTRAWSCGVGRPVRRSARVTPWAARTGRGRATRPRWASWRRSRRASTRLKASVHLRSASASRGPSWVPVASPSSVARRVTPTGKLRACQ